MKTIITKTNSSDINGTRDMSANRVRLIEALKSWQEKLKYFSIFAAVPAILTSQISDAQAVTPELSATTAPTATGLGERPRRRLTKPMFLRASNHLLPYQKGATDIVEPLSGNDNCPGNQIPGGTYTNASPYTDTGDTTGANNTVNRAYYIHYGYYWHDTPGPDHVYTFTLTSRGASPQISVSRTAGTYEPTIYILDGRFGCPAGTGQNAYNEWVAAEAPTGSTTATLGQWAMNFVPLNIPLHLFVDSRHGDARGSGPYTIRIEDLTVASTVGVLRTKYDFDGDSRSDVSVFRPSDRAWYLNRSTQGFVATQFGLSSDKVAPADYDGDNKTDIAVYRDGMWWWINSSNETVSADQFGTIGDSPVPADFNGDGRAELVVYRGGQWYMRDLATGADSLVHFGTATDKPVVADYDGDGRADQAVYRDGQWHLNRSRDGYAVFQWGTGTDKPVVGDYDGDSKADLAVYRNGAWWINRSLYGYYWGHVWSVWGTATDVPVPADYDGDAYTDVAVFRDGVWYIQKSTGGTSVQSFGLAGDKALPAAYVP